MAKPKPPTPQKFPLCEKYDIGLCYCDTCGKQHISPEVLAEEVEQALSKLEKENKTLAGNLEACLDICKQYKAENSKLKARLEKLELELEANREPPDREERDCAKPA